MTNENNYVNLSDNGRAVMVAVALCNFFTNSVTRHNRIFCENYIKMYSSLSKEEQQLVIKCVSEYVGLGIDDIVTKIENRSQKR